MQPDLPLANASAPSAPPALAARWRKANGGKKPKQVLFYGAFGGSEPWVAELKATLGYNTLLPDKYEHVHRDGLHAHAHNAAEIEVETLAAANAEPRSERELPPMVAVRKRLVRSSADERRPKRRSPFDMRRMTYVLQAEPHRSG